MKVNFLHLLYPNLCLNCEGELSEKETAICIFCKQDLKFTHFERYAEESSLDKLFWGRAQINSTFALLYFEKENQTQEILHQIKYKGKKQLATYMGQMIGEKMLENDKFKDIDCLVPIPLHPKKERIRGYNQSEVLAEGIGKATGIELNLNVLKRTVHSESQTKKGRFLRWDNIESAFSAVDDFNLKHIALVDDVVTTGSTLESCIKVLQAKNPNLKISVICLAITK